MANKKPKIEAEVEPKISIKVFVDKVKKRVVYAEADYTFVDILFSFMTLPMGTIIRLLAKNDDKKLEALRSLTNLYQSLKGFPECYFWTEECKYLLLNPRSVSYDHCRYLKLKIDDNKPITYFTCGNCSCSHSDEYYSICNKAKCRRCGQLMNFSCKFDFNVCVVGGVFVSDIATFIVTDDFYVMPYSSESIFQLLTNTGITNMNYLEERVLDMDREQMLHLLKMALSLHSPLTHFVFHSNTRFLDLVCSCQPTTFDHCDFMEKETCTSSKMLLKVSLQKSTGKFLFAEAEENFVDFLFGFLSIPLGTIIGTLMKGDSFITCMDNLFRSISNMSVGRHLKSQDMKDMLVKPHFGQDYVSENMIFPKIKTICFLSFFDYSYYPKDPRIKEVFLRQSGMFFVTDDLIITPASTHLAMNTLSKLKVSFDDVEKFETSIGFEEVSSTTTHDFLQVDLFMVFHLG